MACQANTIGIKGQGGSGAFLLLKERLGLTRPHPKSYFNRAWSRQSSRHPGIIYFP